MSESLISVVIPVFNGERFLAAAIESVLAQDHEPMEVIVVDDGSTDSSAAIAQRYQVRLLRGPNRGRSVARNAGVEAANGDLLGFCDADDLWMSTRVSRQVAHLQANPEDDVVTCWMEVFLEPGIERPAWLKGSLAEQRLAQMPSGMLIRRKAWDRVGPFDPSFEVGEDGDWLMRAKDLGIRLGEVHEVLFRYRIHDSNSMHLRGVHRANLFRALQASIERKKAAEAER